MVAAVTAADLIAGARAMIERLTARPLYASDGKWISRLPDDAADTIAALMDDRDALTQQIEALEQRIEALEAALRDLLPLADEGAAQPGHAGSCGPWESCDSLCMDAAHDARALSAARAALRADEVAQ